MYHPPPSVGFVENSMEGVRMYKVDLYVRVRRACMVEGMSMIRTYIPPVITTYIPPRQVGDGPWTPWYADYYHRAV